ncbi:uncharacterized protein LOC125784434 [Astyanax mexicanus]|uniref:uncharacterized protein LOC125784434 n=1 Tax=Astyanax mexicanus TaxID=7994 RepID=UPI0020CB24B3|nr:uncharacterized protein LOC125784434 [Astyanax mexicanus]
MDAEQDNLNNLTQVLNLTNLSAFLLCNTPHIVAWITLEIIFLLFSFPANMIVLLELLKRKYKKRNIRNVSFPTSLFETFFLQISLINICYCVHIVVLVLYELSVLKVNLLYFNVLYSPCYTAVPLFLVAICVDCYLAVVYPLVYMAVRNLPHRGPMCTALVWAYALTLSVTTIIYKISYFHPINMLSVYLGLPAVAFCNISTLKVLYSAGPEKTNPILNPAKRRAFSILLSILVVMVVYYLPMVLFYTYRFIVPVDREWMVCFEIPMVMLLNTVCGFSTPLVSLHSVGKLSTTFGSNCQFNFFLSARNFINYVFSSKSNPNHL